MSELTDEQLVSELQPNPPSPVPAQTRSQGQPVAWLALVISGLTAAILVTSMATEEELSDTNTQVSSEESALFGAPQDLKTLIDKVRLSTVTVACGEAQGSGWVIDLGESDTTDPEQMAIERDYPGEVITNHHVIEECVDTEVPVEVTSGTTTYDAYLWSWDAGNDLALVGIKQTPPALEVSDRPEPGWWVAAIGTPYGLEGSVSIGNVMNLDNTDVIATAPLNSGNSGGPLVNSRGQVVGTNSWVRIGDDSPQDWNVAVGIQAMCDEIVACDDPYWK